MSSFAKLPSGLILPHDIARETMASYIFGDSLIRKNYGAYRSASAKNKNTVGWETTDGSADADTLGDLPTLRRQSRDLVRNEPLPAGAISTVVTAVVGTGIVPQSRIDYEFLGISEEQAAKLQRRVEMIFNQVASTKSFDSERRQSFWEMQSTVLRGKLESGDIFGIRRYIERPDKMLGLSVQLVEADRVRTPTKLQANKRIREGIEVDKDGAPIKFHITQEHPGEKLVTDLDYTTVPAFDRSGSPVVLAIIPRLRPGQTRGVPYLAPVIEPLKQLARYTEAEITAAVISGMFAVFVKSEAPVSPLPGGIPGQVNGFQVAPTGNGLQKLQSGMIVDLAPGEDISTASATRPNTAFDPFVMSVLRQIGVGLELPFEILIKHYTSSYSAARAAIIEAWRFYMKEREFLIQSFLQPVWEWAFTEAVASGQIEAPGYFDDLLIRQAYLSCDWIGQGMPQIDPMKEAMAAKEWNALGIWSRQDISAQQGRDFDRTFQQLRRENTMMIDAGLKLDPAEAQATNQPQDTEE